MQRVEVGLQGIYIFLTILKDTKDYKTTDKNKNKRIREKKNLPQINEIGKKALVTPSKRNPNKNPFISDERENQIALS